MGYETDSANLEGVASRLRNGASSLESGAGAPPPPAEAGLVTSAVNGLVGALTAALAGVVEGIGAAGDAVATNRDSYVSAEQDAANRMPELGPRQAGEDRCR